MPKAAIYCRLSEEDRNKPSEADDSGSIRNQKAMLLQYATEQGWEVFYIYSDDDYTGSDRNRPEFQRLLRDAEQRKFDIVLCKTQSRFTRELELVERYIHGLFPIWGIRFVSVVDNADTANKGNKKSRQINGLVNEWYLEDMSENIRSVLNNRRQNGFHIGAFALYGYKKDPEQKGHLIIDEEAAAVVREVFTLFSQGHGKTAIARMLNDRGIPNPTEYKRLHGMRYRQTRNSTLWRYSAIAGMLTNEMYLGNMVQGKYGSVSYKSKQNKPRPKSQWYRVENTHEPIIDRDLWERVQAMIAQRVKPFAGGAVGLFAGKVRCAGCGYAMRSSKNRGRRYLRCASRQALPDICAGAFISEEKLEQIVLAELKRLSALYLDTEELLRSVQLCGGAEEQKRRLLEEQSACRKRADKCARCVRELYLDKVKGLISEADFVSMSQEFSGEKTRAEERIASLDAQIADISLHLADGGDRQSSIERYIHPEHLTREAVEVLIDCIFVGKRSPGAKNPPVEIHWNF